MSVPKATEFTPRVDADGTPYFEGWLTIRAFAGSEVAFFHENPDTLEAVYEAQPGAVGNCDKSAFQRVRIYPVPEEAE